MELSMTSFLLFEERHLSFILPFKLDSESSWTDRSCSSIFSEVENKQIEPNATVGKAAYTKPVRVDRPLPHEQTLQCHAFLRKSTWIVKIVSECNLSRTCL